MKNDPILSSSLEQPGGECFWPGLQDSVPVWDLEPVSSAHHSQRLMSPASEKITFFSSAYLVSKIMALG